MSRYGFSTANFLRVSSAVVSAPPFTISAWVHSVVTGAVQSIVSISTSAAANTNSFELVLFPVGDVVGASVDDGVAADIAKSSVAYPVNAPFHACGVFTSNTSRAAYTNGINKGTNATSVTPSGMDRTSIGIEDRSTAASPFSGSIADVAIWNVALNDGEVAYLAAGNPAIWVRPSSLVGYWPLESGAVNEVNARVPGSPMVMQGTVGMGLALPPALLRRRTSSRSVFAC